jgi:hypothetical protein
MSRSAVPYRAYVPDDGDSELPQNLLDLRDEIVAELAGGGPLQRLGVMGLAVVQDGIAFTAKPEEAAAILSTARRRYPGVRFEVRHGRIIPL